MPNYELTSTDHFHRLLFTIVLGNALFIVPILIFTPLLWIFLPLGISFLISVNIFFPLAVGIMLRLVNRYTIVLPAYCGAVVSNHYYGTVAKFLGIESKVAVRVIQGPGLIFLYPDPLEKIEKGDKAFYQLGTATISFSVSVNTAKLVQVKGYPDSPQLKAGAGVHFTAKGSILVDPHVPTLSIYDAAMHADPKAITDTAFGMVTGKLSKICSLLLPHDAMQHIGAIGEEIVAQIEALEGTLPFDQTFTGRYGCRIVKVIIDDFELPKTVQGAYDTGAIRDALGPYIEEQIREGVNPEAAYANALVLAGIVPRTEAHTKSHIVTDKVQGGFEALLALASAVGSSTGNRKT